MTKWLANLHCIKSIVNAVRFLFCHTSFNYKSTKPWWFLPLLSSFQQPLSFIMSWLWLVFLGQTEQTACWKNIIHNAMLNFSTLGSIEPRVQLEISKAIVIMLFNTESTWKLAKNLQGTALVFLKDTVQLKIAVLKLFNKLFFISFSNRGKDKLMIFLLHISWKTNWFSK